MANHGCPASYDAMNPPVSPSAPVRGGARTTPAEALRALETARGRPSRAVRVSQCADASLRVAATDTMRQNVRFSADLLPG